MMDDLRSLRQHVKATRVSYRVATLRLVREAIVARGDGYLRPHEEVALLDVDVRAALALYAAEDALPTRANRVIPHVPSLGRGAFRRDYMYANEPVVVEDVVDGTWGFAAFAGADGGVDVAALAERFGDMPVPVCRSETRGELPECLPPKRGKPPNRSGCPCLRSRPKHGSTQRTPGTKTSEETRAQR